MSDTYSPTDWSLVPTTPEGRPKITVTPGKPADPWTPVGEPTPWYVKAIEPITSYFPTQQRIAQEGVKQMGEGVEALKPESMGGPRGGTAGGLWDVVAGGLKYTGSPIEAGLETVVGKPLEENFGIPKEYPMFAAGLAIPYYGLRGSPIQTTAKKVFTPEALPGAEPAVASIRRESGTAARNTLTTQVALEPHYPLVNTLDDPTRLELIRYMEGRSRGAPLADPRLQAMADDLRTAFEQRKSTLQAMPSHAQMQFVEDYFPHFWKDPNAAANFARSFGAGKQGSGASLKARTVPTIEDGLAAGLTPLTTNPIEATMRYVTSMDRFIAQQKVFDEALGNGTIVYVRPKVMGASGLPDSFKVPSGYVALQGRGATNATGAQAYAPENWARIYNNYISRGFAGIGQEYGTVYNAARQTNNAITALELSLSGYHALTMAQEAMVNEVARAIQQGGRKSGMLEALKTALKSPAAPVLLARKGGQVERVATGVTPGTPEMRDVVDILTEAGARFKGRAHAHDIGSSAAGSFFTAWRRGSLKTEILSDVSEFGQTKTLGKAGLVAKNVGRIMDTTMQPIFEVYIPKLKNGAAYENMADWLRAHPGASRDESVAAARKIVDSIDNRFGEMIQDNLFWNQFLKQSAMVSLRSYSWTMGSIREIAGGVTDTLAGAGRNEIAQRQAYIIALPIVYSLMGATYQYLKTGEPPQDTQDLMAPRTGGIDATTGEPERIVPPGYMKDVFGWTDHPREEAMNKMATGARLAKEMLFTGRDWRGDPIAPPGDEDSVPGNVPSWLKAYFSHVIESMGPISVKQAAKGPRIGSNLNAVERLMGLQPAGMQKTAPEGFEVMMKRKQFREWQRKQMHDEMEKSRYEYKGP